MHKMKLLLSVPSFAPAPPSTKPPLTISLKGTVFRPSSLSSQVTLRWFLSSSFTEAQYDLLVFVSITPELSIDFLVLKWSL